MENWWERSPNERYWCEVTDRSDLGADLKAPKLNESGDEYWGYSLIGEVQSGDIVFHYSTNAKAFVGVSIAGDPMEDRSIIWQPHGTSGRATKTPTVPRPGLWRPLYGFTGVDDALTLSELNNETEKAWIEAWKDAKESEGKGKAKIPFQCRTDGLRGGQGYLFKMPAEFVARWKKLEALSERVASLHETLGEHAASGVSSGGTPTGFHPKDDSDYDAQIRGGKQRRTRNHEKLVRVVGEALQKAGAAVSTPHPIDLLMLDPNVVIFEAKTTHTRTPLRAVREAVGQLLEYRRFNGPHNALLAVLLDQAPDPILQSYVEEDLGMLMVWWDGASIQGTKVEELVLSTIPSSD